MVIAHNGMAMNAVRQLNIVTDKRKKTMERLSSGYRINRAADDAANLAISEKMRRQIRGLTQASANCQDGVSLVQVADGALQETHSILQRMNELAVKSANGTLTDEDRGYIQREVEGLSAEINRIARSTTFNDDFHPLRGLDGIIDSKFLAPNYLDTIDPEKMRAVLPSYLGFETFTTIAQNDLTYNGKNYQKGEMVSAMFLVYKPAQDNRWSSNITESKLVFGMGGAAFNQSLGNPGSSSQIMQAAIAGNITPITREDMRADASGNVYAVTKDGTAYLSIDQWSASYGGGSGVPAENATAIMNAYAEYPALKADYDAAIALYEQEKAKLTCYLQAGAEAGQTITVNMVDATAGALGVGDIDISEDWLAERAITVVADAINKVSQYRSDFGAAQNRLEHTIGNLNNVVENTTSAESAIRDTDMSAEAVQNAIQGILIQAGEQILSQANKSGELVLNLLQ